MIDVRAPSHFDEQKQIWKVLPCIGISAVTRNAFLQKFLDQINFVPSRINNNE